VSGRTSLKTTDCVRGQYPRHERVIIDTTAGADFVRRVTSWSPTVVVSGHDRHMIDGARDYAQSLGLIIVAVLQTPIRVEALRVTLRTIYENKEMISSEETLQATDDGEVFLGSQPIVRLSDQKQIEVEAPARWNHKQQSKRYCCSFIPSWKAPG
jgi:hypothetical protein